MLVPSVVLKKCQFVVKIALPCTQNAPGGTPKHYSCGGLWGFCGLLSLNRPEVTCHIQSIRTQIYAQNDTCYHQNQGFPACGTPPVSS
jgi:hypothetical protein